jgi:hypothetical protein
MWPRQAAWIDGRVPQKVKIADRDDFLYRVFQRLGSDSDYSSLKRGKSP